MRQQAKVTLFRLAPVVMLVVTVAAPRKWWSCEGHQKYPSSDRDGARDSCRPGLVDRCSLEVVTTPRCGHRHDARTAQPAGSV